MGMRKILANTTYCINADCPFTDCEVHQKQIPKSFIEAGDILITVRAFDGVCRRYIADLVEEICNEKPSRKTAKMVERKDNG